MFTSYIIYSSKKQEAAVCCSASIIEMMLMSFGWIWPKKMAFVRKKEIRPKEKMIEKKDTKPIALILVSSFIIGRILYKIPFPTMFSISEADAVFLCITLFIIVGFLIRLVLSAYQKKVLNLVVSKDIVKVKLVFKGHKIKTFTKLVIVQLFQFYSITFSHRLVQSPTLIEIVIVIFVLAFVHLVSILMTYNMNFIYDGNIFVLNHQ